MVDRDEAAMQALCSQHGATLIPLRINRLDPTPWEPVYASSKWAINCFVQTLRRQVFKHGIRVGSISPGPVVTSLLADWPPEKLQEARDSGVLLEASEVAEMVTFMLNRARGMTIRGVVMMPTNFDL